MSESVAQVDLEPRARPVQARAQKTYDRILDTAAALLEERGVEGMTTKLIAERADLRIRSVYRYFPNKLAIIRALAERVLERQKKILQEATRRSDADTPWRVALGRELDALIESFESEPGHVAIRRAMQATPALREIDRHANEEIARLWEGDLHSRGMRGNPARRLLVARTGVRMTAALLDPAERGQTTDRRGQIREFRIVLESYLANYLDDPTN